MLFVRTRLKHSPIEGLGLFAAEQINAGGPIWAFTAVLDSTVPLDLLTSLTPVARDFLNKYCSIDREHGRLIIYADDARFINHSPHPNTRLDDKASWLRPWI
jgi:SET domain-containing protein